MLTPFCGCIFFFSCFNHQAMNLRQWRSLCLNWVGLMLDEQRCEVESGVWVAASLWPDLDLVLILFKATINGSKEGGE